MYHSTIRNIFIAGAISLACLSINAMEREINYNDLTIAEPKTSTLGEITTTVYKAIENKTGTRIEVRELRSPSLVSYIGVIEGKSGEKEGIPGDKAKDLYATLATRKKVGPEFYRETPLERSLAQSKPPQGISRRMGYADISFAK